MTVPARSTGDEVLLWQALQRREPAAYERLALRVEATCGPVFRRAGATPEQVDALLQDVLVSVWAFAHRRREAPAHLGGFLFWRARAVWSGFLRERKGGPVPAEEILLGSGESEQPPDALALRELQLALADCRLQLPDAYREVWEARYERGMSPAESAELLGIEKAKVAVRLHRARGLLERCLHEKGVLP